MAAPPVHDCSTNRLSWSSCLRRNVLTQRRPMLLRCASPEAKAAQEVASSDTSDVADAVLARFSATPTPPQTAGPGSFPVRAFFSQSDYFHLDGRWENSDGSVHPDGILTACSSANVTLREFASSDLCAWNARYIVESIQGDNTGPEDAVRSIARRYTQGDEWCDALSSWGDNNLPAMHQLFVSVGKTRTQLHRDHFDNLFLCLSGTRHWRLADPEHSGRVQLEEGSVSARFRIPPPGYRSGDCAGQSFVHNDVLFTELTLGAGDALFVPSGWWHDVTANIQGSASSVAVNWYFEPPKRDKV